MRDDFIATLTHDLKTPVRADILSLELLLKGHFGTLMPEQKEIIEEKQDKVSEDILKTYNYWVVVYDQFDNEISRDAIKYGTTIKDPDGNDVVVNGNKYFHTYVDYSPVQAPNPPAPLCSNTNTLIHFYNVQIHMQRLHK